MGSRAIRFLKSQITKAENRSKNMKDYNIYNLKHFLEELEKDYLDFKSRFMSEESDLNEDEFEEYEIKYSNAVALYQEEIDRRLNRDPKEILNNSDNNENRLITSMLDRQHELNETIGRIAAGLPQARDNRLPTLKIPRFSGSCKDWFCFKSLFLSRIDGNATLSEVEKFGHLLTLVEGEAASLIKNLPLVEASYTKAWEILTSKYDKPYKIANCFISDLARTPPVTSRMAFRSFYSTFNESLSALDSMGGYCKLRDPWIIFMALEKLDKRVRDKWAHKLAVEEVPSLRLFLRFLEEEDEAVETFGFSENERSNKPGNKSSNCKGLKSNAAFSLQCLACGENHEVVDCKQFKNMTVKNRFELIKSKHRCLNCFGSGHFVNNCSANSKCSKCGKKHHTLLHHVSTVPSTGPSTSENEKVDSSLLKVNVSSNNGSIILPTAIIEILGNNNSFVKCRALLDSGSQASFITEACLKRLNLKRLKNGILFETMSSSHCLNSRGSVKTIFRSLYNLDNTYCVNLNVINKITSVLPSRKERFVSKEMLSSKFQLADPDFDTPSGIEILLGAEFLFEIIKSQKYFHSIDKLWILESSLGWLISGGSDAKPDVVKVNCNFESHDPDRLDRLVKEFWDLDVTSMKEEQCAENLYCEEHFRSTIKRLDSGRYSVSLPFRKTDRDLGSSYCLAMNRFKSLERKFEKNNWYRSEYFKLIEFFDLNGFIEKIMEPNLSALDKTNFYLPHHGVGINKSKLRIVFDASMKTDNGLSLNDVLYSGPNLQPDLRALLIEFRFHKYVFVTDISKMYRQIFVNEDSRDVQRFLWRDNENSEIETYRIVTVTDGLSCSPFLALRTMNQLAEDEALQYPLGSKYLSKRYMDDLFIGHECLNELKEIKSQLIGILKSACMSLSKWCANDPELLINIAKEDKLSNDRVEIKSDQIIRTLGVAWSFCDDIFTYNFELNPILRFSKRMLLSDSAKVFDPLGWITPITVELKILFQECCIRKLDWDDDLPKDISDRWMELRDQMNSLRSVRLHRWIRACSGIEIHGFCDASLKAYACVIYSRSFDADGKETVSLIMAKSRIAPIKTVTIARLELCGAHLLAKSLEFVLKSFENFKPSILCWTDSTTVLAWLSSHPSRWKNFVANRCGEIHKLLPNVCWKYVKSSDNPADVASRGLTPKALLSVDLWWSGPFHRASFFDKGNDDLQFTNEELKSEKVKCFGVSRIDFWESFCARFSLYVTLVRVAAYMLRVFDRKSDYSSLDISSREFHDAFMFIIKKLQEQFFFDEYQSLNLNRKLSAKSKLSTLNPFIDSKGVIRSAGRLFNAPISYETKFPVVLPKSSLLKVLIRYYHVKYYHANKKLLISLLRQRFWIFRIQNEVNGIINDCVHCKRLKGIAYDPAMGSVPEYRLKLEKPFLRSGIDFAGPISVRPFKCRGNTSVKSYVAVMVCMVTKALHLELVLGLDVESLINALKRFVARRGRCGKLYSDNGTNFVGCNNQINSVRNEILKTISCPSMKKFLIDELMEWEFIPPATPHMGGLWESSVKSVKELFKNKFVNITPTIEEMSTSLAEIESLLNSRPLFAVFTGNEEFEAITPAHLISGFPTSVLPIYESSEHNLNPTKRLTILRNLLRRFWNDWSKTYLNDLRKLYKWRTSGREPRKNDVVVIKRNNLPPSYWPMGIVVELFPGADGVVRIVNVKQGNKIKQEASRNLVPLLVEAQDFKGEFV